MSTFSKQAQYWRWVVEIPEGLNLFGHFFHLTGKREHAYSRGNKYKTASVLQCFSLAKGGEAPKRGKSGAQAWEADLREVLENACVVLPSDKSSFIAGISLAKSADGRVPACLPMRICERAAELIW
jgi:hypothetical protein